MWRSVAGGGSPTPSKWEDLGGAVAPLHNIISANFLAPDGHGAWVMSHGQWTSMGHSKHFDFSRC